MQQKPHQQSQGSDFIVRVSSGCGPSLKGKVEHIKTGQIQYFNDFLELILLIQHKLDENNYPQSDSELRGLCYEDKL